MGARFLALAIVLLLVTAAPPAAAAPDPNPDVGRWIESTYEIAFRDLTFIELDGRLEIHELTLGGRTYTARDIRESYQQAARIDPGAGDAFLAQIEGAIRDETEALLQSAFPTAARRELTSLGFDRASVEGASLDAFEPPVVLDVAAEVERSLRTYGLGRYEAADVLAVFEAGAQLRTDLTLPARAGNMNTFRLGAIPGLGFADPDDGTLAEGATVLVVERDNRRGSTTLSEPVSVSILDPDARPPTSQDASVDIVVDLTDIDVTLGGALGGDMGDLAVDVAVVASFSSLAVPAEIKDDFPGSLTFDYLSSDAIRVLLDRGLITAENWTRLEDSLLDAVSERLGGALGGDIVAAGGIDDASVSPALISDPLSGEEPIVFRAATTLRKPLAGGPAVQTSAAIALYTAPAQSFTLPKVKGLDTTYTMVLPPGISVADLQVAGGSRETGTWSDGREYFRIAPAQEEATASVSMAVTPSFVMAKFWPVVLVAGIVLFLLVAGPVALVAARRRKKQG